MLDLFPVFTLKVGCRGKYKSLTFWNRCLPPKLTRNVHLCFPDKYGTEQNNIYSELCICVTPVREVPPVRLSMSTECVLVLL